MAYNTAAVALMEVFQSLVSGFKPYRLHHFYFLVIQNTLYCANGFVGGWRSFWSNHFMA